MSFSIKFGNFLYKNAFFLYRPLYYVFKNKQDKFEIDLLKKLIRPGARVVDIGANIGFYAGIISELCGEAGNVHCFEPDRINFMYLQKACTGKKNITLNQKAVSAPSSGGRPWPSRPRGSTPRSYSCSSGSGGPRNRSHGYPARSMTPETRCMPPASVTQTVSSNPSCGPPRSAASASAA